MLRLHSPRATLLGALICWLAIYGTACAGFTTILNIPIEDPNIGDNESIGSDTQLNLFDGGTIGENFDAGASNGTSTNVEVNIFGGVIGEDFKAHTGSTITLSGGTIGDDFVAEGLVNVVDGTIGKGFDANEGSTVNLFGGSIGRDFDASFGSTVNISNGLVNNRFDTDGTVNISGGTVSGLFFTGILSEVDITGGLVTGSMLARGTVNVSENATVNGLIASFSSDVNISGGNIGHGMRADNESEVTISGGTVGHSFRAIGSVVSISGGNIGSGFRAFLDQGNQVNLSGGTIGDGLRIDRGNNFNISGNEFRLDGELIDGLTMVNDTLFFDLPNDAILSGTLADGTPFALSLVDGDGISDGTLSLTTFELPNIGPSFITLPNDPAPFGIREGQILVVENEGELGDNFNAGLGSVVNIHGGQVGQNLEVVGAQVMITGGSIGHGFDAFQGSVVDIFGGTVSERFAMHTGSEVNLIGTQFEVNDIDITPMLLLNMPFTIVDRDVTLNGELADGSQIGFDLTSISPHGSSYFDPNATLTVTLILPGDYNGDGMVDALDYTVWRDNLGSSINLPGDTTPGTVTEADYVVWQSHFGETFSPAVLEGATVPEPASVVLLIAAGFCLCRGRVTSMQPLPPPALRAPR